MTERYAAYCGTSNLHKAMWVSASSLLENSSADFVWLLTDKEPPKELQLDRVEWCVVENKWFRPDGPNMTSKFTWMAMLRAALAFVLPVDRVLSLDVDTVCLRNIDGVWNIDVTDMYFAASHENHRTHNGFMYCNTGVALYNLEKLRDGKASEVIEVLNRQYYTWVEQDVMNYLCQGRMVDMPSKYNTTDFTDKCLAPCIKHFAGKSAWLHEPEFKPWLDKYPL